LIEDKTCFALAQENMHSQCHVTRCNDQITPAFKLHYD